MKKTMLVGIVSFLVALILTGCASGNDDMVHEKENNESIQEDNQSGTDHVGMDHSSSSSEVPEGLNVASNPTYAVGSTVLIEEGHMQGMEGAEATIVGAYDTFVYAVSYTTTAGKTESNHKWVIHEELADVGEEVVLEADHMVGMKDAVAEVDFVEETTVYMVDRK